MNEEGVNRPSGRKRAWPALAAGAAGAFMTALLAVQPLEAQADISADGTVESQAGGLRFPDGSVQPSSAASGPAPVEDTGQQACWGVGVSISCAGTGQDGELQAGVVRPTPRFSDNGNGTVTDNLTGLIWLKDASCLGGSWGTALLEANALMTGSCGLTDGSMPTDWRLPNILELQSLVDWNQEYPPFTLEHPFTDLIAANYWSSTTVAGKPERAWALWFTWGLWQSDFKLDGGSVWPVKNANQSAVTGASREPEDVQTTIAAEGVIESTAGGFKFPDGTLQITAARAVSAPVEVTGLEDCWDETGAPISCAGTGQDGDHRAGVPWPVPRFTDNGDGTVTDHLTDLVWLQLANCFGLRTWESALSDANTLTSGSCGLSDGSTAGEWRLPNIKELFSLIDFTQLGPALPLDHPFSGVQEDIYWSSTTRVGSSSSANGVSWSEGAWWVEGKNDTAYVWPVRGGH